MTNNLGTWDRALRALFGLGLLGFALGVYGPDLQSGWGWIGLLVLGTAVFGFCPAYTLLGMSTCSGKS